MPTWLGLLVAIGMAGAQAKDSSLLYTPQERQILATLQANPTASTSLKLRALQELSKQPAFESLRDQALLVQQQCDLAIRKGIDPKPYLANLKQLKERADNHDTAPEMLAQLCELRRLQYADQPPALEDIWRHYRNMQTLGLPSLSYEVASMHGHLAHSLGLLDEALKSTEAALKIANANDDSANESNSLMDLAMVQVDLGLKEDALRNSATALANSKGKNQLALLANRGYVQIGAGDFDAAENTYQEVLKLTQKAPTREGPMFSALVNLAHIYTIQNRLKENLSITAQAMPVAERLGLPADLGYAESSRAIALIAAGEVDEARRLFNEGQRHLEIGEAQDAMTGFLTRWSQQLSKRGLWREAYDAAERARLLNEKIDASQRQRAGQHLSALHESAKKDQTLAALKHESRVTQLESERRKTTNIAWALGLCTAMLVLSVLTRFYLRLRKTNSKLHYENAHDPLTQLRSRLYFTEHFKQQADQACGGRAILALLDIDHFKKINDTWGHARGDEVLQEVAKRLSTALRANDVIARWGGEEIVILVQDLHPQLRAQDFAERLRDAVARSPLQLADQEITVTASIGYLEFELNPDSHLDTLLPLVDERLYAAKRMGRNRTMGEEKVDS